MPQKRKYLGTDKCGKPWYVFHKRVDNAISFFVFSEKYEDKDINWESQYIASALVHKISMNRAIIENIAHEKSEDTTSDVNTKNNLYEQTSSEDIELDNILSASDYSASVAELEEPDYPEKTVNYENRGIGTMLLRYVESWARKTHIHTLYGFIFVGYDTEKLKKYYTQRGWRVRIFSGKSLVPRYPLATGIFRKKIDIK